MGNDEISNILTHTHTDTYTCTFWQRNGIIVASLIGLACWLQLLQHIIWKFWVLRRKERESPQSQHIIRRKLSDRIDRISMKSRLGLILFRSIILISWLLIISYRERELLLVLFNTFEQIAEKSNAFFLSNRLNFSTN